MSEKSIFKGEQEIEGMSKYPLPDVADLITLIEGKDALVVEELDLNS